jgi:hypothetical protein
MKSLGSWRADCGGKVENSLEHSLINLARKWSQKKRSQKPISQRTQIPFAIYKQSIHVFIIEEAKRRRRREKNDKNYRKTQQVDIRKKRLTHATRPKKLDWFNLLQDISSRMHRPLVRLSRFELNKCPKMIASKQWSGERRQGEASTRYITTYQEFVWRKTPSMLINK